MLFRRVLAAQVKRPKSSFVSANAVQHFEEIPSPKGLPIIGTTLSLLAEGSTPKLHKYVNKRHKQLGPIYKERLGPVYAVFVSDPDEIRDVFAQEGKYPMHLLPDAWVAYNHLHGCPRGLFFMNGPNWWHHRRIMNRILLKGDLKWIDDSCECVIDKLITYLRKTAVSDRYYENLEETLYRWSLDSLVAVLLGSTTYQRNAQRLEEETEKLSKIVNLVFKTSAKMSLIPASFASKYKISRWNQFVDAVNNALLGASLLVDGLMKDLTPESDGLLPKLLTENMDVESIKRIIVDLILAAGDTSSHAMAWVLYKTGQSREIQDELRANPDFVKYVFKETLRLYPVATFLTRILPEDSILCGYGVPKGTPIVLSMFTSGRDERYFKNPDFFDPWRWDREHNKDYNIGMQKATLPFAMGMRSCVGKKLAETQLYNTLIKIVNNFNIEVGNTRDVDITLKMVAVPSEPIKLKFKKL